MATVFLNPNPLSVEARVSVVFDYKVDFGAVTALGLLQGLVGDIDDAASIVGPAGAIAAGDQCRMGFASDRAIALKIRADEMNVGLGRLLSQGQAGANATADVDASCATIPTVGGSGLFSLGDLGGFLGGTAALGLTCLSQSQWEGLDPKVRLDALSRRGSRRVGCIMADFRKDLRGRASWPVIRTGLLYLEDLKLLGFENESGLFACVLQAVLGSFPGLGSGSPINVFGGTTSDMDLTSLLPVALDPAVQSFMESIVKCEVKLRGWRKAAVVRS